MIKSASREETIPLLLQLQETARKRLAVQKEIEALTGISPQTHEVAHSRVPLESTVSRRQPAELAYR